MPEPSSPFDDGYEDRAPPPRRQRRPWWRWNIIALFVALFLLAWVRELLGLSPLATWLSVFLVFGLWALAPAPFVLGELSTMPRPASQPAAPPIEPSVIQWRRRNGVLVFFKVLAIVLLSLSALHMLLNLMMVAIAVFGYSRSMGQDWGAGITLGLTFVMLPILEIIGAALMYLLAEIAMRLDRPPWEARRED